jgi:hypothetical protein
MSATYPDPAKPPPSLTDSFRLYEQPFPTGDYTFVQLAFIVDDLQVAVRHWVELYGVGPFYVLPRASYEGTYRGQPVHVQSQIAVSQAGPLQVELIQAFGDQPNVYAEITRGAVGAHHLATMTQDYDAALAHYQRLGHEPAMELRSAGVGRIAYIDTRAEVGLFTEVIEHSEQFLRALKGTARRCAGWDGSDPVRIIDGGAA